MPKEVAEEAERQLGRLERMHPDAAETATLRNYMDWMVSLPWAKSTKDNLELDKAQNILDEDQQDLSSCFARNGRDRFEGVEWRPGETGSPILPGALATIECSVSQLVEAGDHWIVLGSVSHAAWREGEPLIYFNSSYRTLRSETSAS